MCVMKTRGGIVVFEKENVLCRELKENIKGKINGKVYEQAQRKDTALG